MIDLTSLALFMTATLALNLAPGPDMLYVSTRSLTQGRRAGVISALGIAAGSVVHTVAIASGLAALLHAVPLAYEIVRYAGAANILNPKVALFFLAFLPQFVDPERGSLALQIVVLGCLFNTSGTLVNIAVAYLAASAGRWLGTRGPFERIFRWLTASVFIGLGLRLALGERK
jgi:threonine/homoserine/homoserine lactone efflux protein